MLGIDYPSKANARGKPYGAAGGTEGPLLRGAVEALRTDSSEFHEPSMPSRTS